MRKLAFALGVLTAGVVVVVVVSSRNLAELTGYVKATADQTVEGMEESVPNAIRDQKLKNDIEQARGDIIDRRVKLNLAASEIRRMQDEISKLAAATRRRETILAEAYPALEAAAANRVQEVSFAGSSWLPTELGAEIDRLLMEQDRDERQLTIRQEALDRLVKSVDEGSAAIAQMGNKLLEAENEFQALTIRREQAHNENELLDLVASAGRNGKTTTAQIGSSLDGLREDVHLLEARNEARRETAPLGERDASRLTQAYDRLDRLKSLHEKRQSAGLAAADAKSATMLGERNPVTLTDRSHPPTTTVDVSSASAEPASDNRVKPADRNVVIVIKDAQVGQSSEEQN